MPWGAAIAAVGAIGGAAMNKDAKDKETESHENQVQTSREYIEAANSRAERGLLSLFPAAQQSRSQGNQGALDMFRGGLDAQNQLYQGGNVAAQNQLISGSPQQQNALMGMPVNTNFQAYQAQIPQLNIPNLPQAQDGGQIVAQANAAQEAEDLRIQQEIASNAARAAAIDQEQRGNYADHLGGWELQLADDKLGANPDHDWRDITGMGMESFLFDRYF